MPSSPQRIGEIRAYLTLARAASSEAFGQAIVPLDAARKGALVSEIGNAIHALEAARDIVKTVPDMTPEQVAAYRDAKAKLLASRAAARKANQPGPRGILGR